MNPSDKKFKLPASEIKELAPRRGACVTSDHITVNGFKVGFMQREQPRDKVDSGWNFFSGKEDEDFNGDAKNFAVYDVNTIANYDPAIIPYLDAPYETCLIRVEDSDEFEEIPYEPFED
jgi:hypothetical protein